MVNTRGGRSTQDLRTTLSRPNSRTHSRESMQLPQPPMEPLGNAQQTSLPALLHEEERPRMTVTEAVGHLLEALGRNLIAEVVPNRVDPATLVRERSIGCDRPRHSDRKSDSMRQREDYSEQEPPRSLADRLGPRSHRSVLERLGSENTATRIPKPARYNPRRRREEAIRRQKEKEKIEEQRAKNDSKRIEESNSETPELARWSNIQKITELEKGPRDLQRHIKGKDGPTTRFSLSACPFTDKVVCDSSTQLSNKDSKEVVQVPINLLPDELLERILVYLPIAIIFRAGCVCKRWNEIVSSSLFLQSSSQFPSGKPWYFMFTNSDEPVGYAYDPILMKWHSIQLPCIEASNWFSASSCGLVCFMDSDIGSQLYVCNPITKSHRKIEKPQDSKYSDYSALGISVERKLCSANVKYCVSVVNSKQIPGNFFQWDVSIHIYDSETMTWETPTSETLSGWRAGNDSVICDGVLYFLVHSTGGNRPDHRHGLITHSLSSKPTHGSLMRSFIPMPCSLTCGRLMNHKESLLMVGGIAERDRPDIMKGIGIWTLKGMEWQKIAHMPNKFFQGFGELDDVFVSSGTGNLVYIQSYEAPALLIFDVEQKQWKWSNKCPVTKRFSLQLFTGFCFEPRLEITP